MRGSVDWRLRAEVSVTGHAGKPSIRCRPQARDEIPGRRALQGPPPSGTLAGV